MLIFACKSHEENIPVTSSKISYQDSLTLYKKFDIIDSFFNTSNWKMIDGKDTVYYYFSRQSATAIKVYRFNMKHGDSINSVVNNMQVEGNEIVWNLDNTILINRNADKTFNNWVNKADNNALVKLIKKNDVEIEGSMSNKKIKLHKTLSLSLFLVRSHYDFLNGTKYAQDSIDFFKPKTGKAIK